MNPLIQTLLAAAPIVTDGAWGTQLQERGLPMGHCPEAWNRSRPAAVEAVARSYVEAGSQVLLTNTFGANRIALHRHGLADQAEAINRAGVAISREAAGDGAHVFASMGPTGALLAMADISEEEARAAFQEQALALAAEGAEAVVIETMTDLAEACLAVVAARETGLPVVACMVFGAGRNGDRTMMGVPPEQAVEALAAAGADVIGTNCGTGPASLLPICERLKAATALPVWVKPNAGLPELSGGAHPKAIYRTTPPEFAAEATPLLAAGAAFIGGCCGTTPDHIRALVTTLRGEARP